MNICYWAPFTSKVATITAVINSAESLIKFSNNKIKTTIINAFGEWIYYQKDIDDKKIIFVSLSKFNLSKLLFCTGYIKSRFAYLFIYLYSFFPLLFFLKKYKPNFLIIHLLTSLPLTLLLIFNFETKFILRISGRPKMNFLRKFFWRLASKKIYKITFPTFETYNYFMESNIFDKEKMIVMYDPIIDIEKIRKNKKEVISENNLINSKYILSVGRFTNQKNFDFLIRCFYKISKEFKDLNLIIIGEGEKNNYYKNLILTNNLEKKVFLLDYKKNIFKYMNKASCLVSTSLWEDPGFVMVEAAALNLSVISSDCPSGPKEILLNGQAGYLFKSNNSENFIKIFREFYLEEKKLNFKKLVLAKKNSINFTRLRHFNVIKKILC
jgi:glycosyltransferase involved in cell wall biosynthesis